MTEMGEGLRMPPDSRARLRLPEIGEHPPLRPGRDAPSDSRLIGTAFNLMDAA